MPNAQSQSCRSPDTPSIAHETTSGQGLQRQASFTGVGVRSFLSQQQTFQVAGNQIASRLTQVPAR